MIPETNFIFLSKLSVSQVGGVELRQFHENQTWAMSQFMAVELSFCHRLTVSRVYFEKNKYGTQRGAAELVCDQLSSIKGRLPSKVVFCQRSSSVKGRPPSKVVFHQRSSSVKGHPPSKVVFRQWSSSDKGRFPSKVVFHQRSPSVKGCLLSKVVFRQRSSSVKGLLPSKVAFHQRSSSVKGHLLSEVVFRPTAPRLPPSYPRSESSNYKLGRLDKKIFVIFFVIFGGRADQPTDLGIEAPSRSLKNCLKS